MRERNREMEWLHTRLKSIKLIQRQWRGRQGRMSFAVKLAQWRHDQLCWEYAVKIQRLWRGRCLPVYH